MSGTAKGFSFGLTQTATASPGAGTPSNTTPGFALGTGTLGFGFGNAGTQASSAGLGAGGASGTTALGSTPALAGSGVFSLGGAKTSASTGFNLGGGSTTSPASLGFSAAAPSPAGFSLGGASTAATSTKSGGLLSELLSAPASSSSAATGFSLGLLGQNAATTTTSLKFGPQAASTLGGFAFSGPTTVQSTATTTAVGFGTAATTTQSAGATGFGFGTPATTVQTTGTTSGTGFGFGAPVATTQSSGTTSVTGFGFPSSALSTPVASTGLCFGAATTSSGTGVFPLGSSTTSTAVSSLGVPSQSMNYRQLEDQINKWMTELEEQEKLFLQQATEVNAWDRLLVDNGEKITQLNSDMERVKVDQNKLEQELEFIKSQQRELEDLLVPLERSLEQLPSSSLLPHADLERENTYQLADNIDAQLKRMVQDLKEIIDHLNTSSSSQDTNDPILQITKILNAHMDSLQWIDTNTALLGRRVEDISKQMEGQRKDQERNFRLVYD